MATINDIGIPELGTGILQPKMKNRWRLIFNNIGGGADSQPLSIQAVTVSRPSLSFEEVQLDRYNSRAYVAGKYTWEPCAIAFEDDVTSGAARIIQEQIQAQQYLTGVEGAWLAAAPEGSSYKFTTRLDMLDGNEAVIEQWHMEGCFLQAVDYTDLDYAASDKVMINCTVRFDHARQTVGPYNSGQGVATGA